MPSRRTRLSVDEGFGRILAELRLERRLSQTRLGNEAGSGRTFISDLERARRGASLKTVFRLAEQFGVTPSEIVRWVEVQLTGR